MDHSSESAGGAQITLDAGLSVSEVQGLQRARMAFVEKLDADPEALDLMAELAHKVFEAAAAVQSDCPALALVDLLQMETKLNGYTFRFQVEKEIRGPNLN